MAELPVEAELAPIAPLPTVSPPQAGPNILVGFARLPIVRQLGLLIVLAGCVAVGVSVVLWMQEPEYRALTGVGSAGQANKVVGILKGANIQYTIDHTSGMLLVPKDRIHEVRMLMAGSNIGDGGQMGFELLDQEPLMGIVASQPIRR